MRTPAWISALLVAVPAWANDAFFAAEVVDAVAAAQAPARPGDPAWGAAPAKRFPLAAQRSVYLHDKRANAVLASGGGRSEVQVQAIVTGQALTLRLEWPDAAREVIREDESNAFADSVAVEVPRAFGPGKRLPAISMGDDGAHVDVAMLRATREGALESRFVAAGFGSLTRLAKAAPSASGMTWDEAAKRWSAVITVPLVPGAGLVPVAVAAWDGARQERSGYKRLSSWHFVRVPGRPVDAAWVKDLSYGYNPGDLGNVEAGRALAGAVCIACHHLPGKAFVPRGLAPGLEAVGAINTAGYLRDSVMEPSQVIVHEPNPNQHYSPEAPRDPNGAAPNNDAFRWSTVGEDGRRVSKMPAFAQFSPVQLADLVAYLKSLDGNGKEQP
jgi:DMSO reductase family type II enzyme heme b subunit